MEIGGFFMIGVSRLVQVFAKCFLKIASLQLSGLSTGNRSTCPLIGKDLDLAASVEFNWLPDRRTSG
jgi:hypothetical protein